MKKLDLETVETLASLDREPIEDTFNNSLAVRGNDLTNQIIAEEDPDKLEDLTNLFKMNQKKKDIVRANKLSNLLELVDDEVILRVATTPELFDNDQLLNYMKGTENSIAKINQTIDQQPLIQINNQKNEININSGSGLDMASRKRVLDAVREILDSAQDINVIDVDGEVEDA